jgi:hypothetical protein
VGPGAGLDRCGKSRPTGTRSPDLPVRSESLYRLRYPATHFLIAHKYNPHSRFTSGKVADDKVLQVITETGKIA